MKSFLVFYRAPFALFLVLAAFVSASAQTPADMTREACDAYQKADCELNRLYQQICKCKGSAVFLTALRNEQRIWTTMRDSRL